MGRLINLIKEYKLRCVRLKQTETSFWIGLHPMLKDYAYIEMQGANIDQATDILEKYLLEVYNA